MASEIDSELIELKPDVPQIKKIYPTADELSSVNNNLQCYEEGCNQIFTSGSNLLMHVQKKHKRQELAKNEECIIYHHHCPELNCIYHETRHFKKMKYLKQHYLKIHANKNYVCDFCQKAFSTLTLKNSHSEVCGIEFTCSDCQMKYSSYESLITHGRRKNHNIAPRSTFIRNNCIDLKKCSSDFLSKKVAIPKRSISMQTIKIVPFLVQVVKSNMIDREIQTEPFEVKGKAVKRRSNIFTQTCPRRKIRRSAETQTIGDCILKKAIQDAKLKECDSSEKVSVRKCIETQTKDAFWFEKGAGEHCSTQTIATTDLIQSKDSSVSLDTISSEDLIHSSSQTSVNSLNYFEEFGNCQETQTDIFQDDFLNSSFNLANIQTQTNAELDLCSNMYTQTCEDQLLSDFGFSNIQTQTTWPDYDLFVSAETQTLLTQSTKGLFDMPINSIREISHMETQTDMEFRQLLEEINA